MTALPLRVQEYEKADLALRDNLELYCAKLCRITTKRGGAPQPFVWNTAQKLLHAKLERQLDSRGLVRAIVLKARRLGISTYVAARFYRKSTLWLGQRTFILTHEEPATKTMFEMVKRLHEHMPGDFRPETLAKNANELDFAGQDSGYRVGTAQNTKGRGRGGTIQLFHGSELGFWAQAEAHWSGVIQSISLMPDTEIILESTANGVGGVFYDQWCLAEQGQSDYIPIFLPWTIDLDNARSLDTEYEPSLEEEEYQRLYKLSAEQLCWMHFKNVELGGEPGVICPRFRQEFPATAAEAFQTTGEDSLIAPQAILRARHWEAPDQSALPRVLGVDVARGGADRTRIVDRQGRKAGLIDVTMHTADLVQVAHAVMTQLRDNPDIRKAFIDVTGIGAGVYDIVRNNGFERRVSGVNFGSSAQDADKYKNRRAEMWARMKQWFLDPGMADIPDSDDWHRSIAAPSYKYDFNSRLQLEDKETIKKRVGFSPDAGDALALCFAEVLSVEIPDDRPKWLRKHLAEDDEGFGDFMCS